MKTFIKLALFVPVLSLLQATGGVEPQQAITKECAAECNYTCRQQYPILSQEFRDCYQACTYTYCM